MDIAERVTMNTSEDLIKKQRGEMKEIEQTEKDFNHVVEKTYDWIGEGESFDGYETLTVVNGMLHALFTWIYHIAPSFIIANKTILACLENVDKIHKSDIN